MDVAGFTADTTFGIGSTLNLLRSSHDLVQLIPPASLLHQGSHSSDGGFGVLVLFEKRLHLLEDFKGLGEAGTSG